MHNIISKKLKTLYEIIMKNYYFTIKYRSKNGQYYYVLIYEFALIIWCVKLMVIH